MDETRPPPRSRSIYLLPNLFTTAGLFAGFYAIIAASNGDFVNAAVAVFVAGVMDGLDGRVECVEAVGFDQPLIEGAAPYDLVFANILKQPLIDLVPDMARYVAHGGRAILSGILTTQADEVVAAYAAGARFFEVKTVQKMDGAELAACVPPLYPRR